MPTRSPQSGVYWLQRKLVGNAIAVSEVLLTILQRYTVGFGIPDVYWYQVYSVFGLDCCVDCKPVS